MRATLIVPLFFMAAGLLLPSGLAKEEPLGHVSIGFRQLHPGESFTYPLVPDADMGELDFEHGWIVLAYAQVVGEAPLMANFTHAGHNAAQWTWAPNASTTNSTRLEHTGEYNLTIWNPPTNRTSGYYFYYDQSCNCAEKPIPLPGGAVLFNWELPANRQVHVDIPLVSGWTVNGTIATRAGDGGVWPEDFEQLVMATASGPKWLNFSFKTDRADTYYMWVRAEKGAVFDPTHDDVRSVDLTPALDVAELAKSPGPGFVSLASAAAIAVAAVARRR